MCLYISVQLLIFAKYFSTDTKDFANTIECLFKPYLNQCAYQNITHLFHKPSECCGFCLAIFQKRWRLIISASSSLWFCLGFLQHSQWISHYTMKVCVEVVEISLRHSTIQHSSYLAVSWMHIWFHMEMQWRHRKVVNGSITASMARKNVLGI